MAEDFSGYTILIKKAGLYLAVALVLALLDWRGMMDPVRGGLERAIVSVRGVSSQLAILMQKPMAYVNYISLGVDRTASLEQRLKQASIDYAYLKSMEQENQELKRLLEQDNGTSTVPFVAASLLTGSHQAIVNKGTLQGVTQGSVVVDPQGILVGRVKLSRPYVSILERPLDSTSRIAVRLSGQATSGVLVGKGDKVVMEGVLQAEPLEVGNVVVTSGTDDLYPPDLVIGTVTAVLAQAADVTKQAAVELLAKETSVKVLRLE